MAQPMLLCSIPIENICIYLKIYMNNEQIPPKYKKAKLQLINAYY